MSRSLCPPNGASAKERAANPERDDVMTPPDLAAQIITHFAPTGRVLEPCRGSGAFWREGWEWCEIREGRDFLTHDFGAGARFDWTISNPPFSLLRSFLCRSMELSDNVVFLCHLNAILGLKARLRDVKNAGFGIREVLLVDTPPVSTGWPQSGFQCAATHLQRGYHGDVKWGSLDL